MIILNLRHGSSTWRFGAPTWFDAAGRPLGLENVRAHVGNKRICVLCHGYNVEDAVPAYREIERRLSGMYDAILGVQMPLSQVFFGFLPARARADRAGALLKDILRLLPVKSMDLQGHSLGCHVVLAALRAGLFATNVLLAAPAVDQDALAKDGEFESAASRVVRLAVFYSRRDRVLQLAYTAADRIDALFRPKSRARLALGYQGPAGAGSLPHNVQAFDCTEFIADHSAYKSAGAYYARWRELLG